MRSRSAKRAPTTIRRTRAGRFMVTSNMRLCGDFRVLEGS
jgi:hypothetical protein